LENFFIRVEKLHKENFIDGRVEGEKGEAIERANIFLSFNFSFS
jgi:hypothetical protein